MTLFRVLFCATFVAVCPPAGADAPATPVEGARSPHEPRAIAALLPTLDAWITAYSDYPETDRPLAAIRLVEPGYALDHHGQTTVLGGTIRGVYDAETATIYLLRPWFADRPEDQSVLLHELIHHRQVEAKHWYCGQAMEWNAYKLQEAFLEAHGIDPGFHWASILLESSCAVRDHHPD